MLKANVRLPFRMLGIPVLLNWSFLVILPLMAWMIGSDLPELARLLGVGDAGPGGGAADQVKEAASRHLRKELVMSHILKAGAGGLGLCALYLAIGCASTGAGDSGPTPVAATASAGPSTQAVSCSRCQVTYIQVQTNDPKGRFIGYTARKEMECPDCKTAAQTFFDTGKLQHTCTRCQGTMEVCEGHT